MEVKLNILCVYWRGTARPGWTDRTLAVQYVNRLYQGIRRNLDTPFRFICLTNEPMPFVDGVEKRPLRPLSWVGCLPKLNVHDPSLGLAGRVLVFDLDTVIVGDLADIAGYDGPFITRAWFKGIQRGVWLSGGDLLGFEAGETSWLWDKASSNPGMVERFTGGRERFVYREWVDDLRYWQRELPGQVISYKRHVQNNKGTSERIPSGARVISCHGRPRPHQMTDIQWVKEHWVNGDST